jgi:copper chaperone CopZ
MNEITVSVPEMHCEACQASIEGALRPLEGVERVDVDLVAKVVRVAYREPASPEALSQAIEEQGYDVASISNGEVGR